MTFSNTIKSCSNPNTTDTNLPLWAHMLRRPCVSEGVRLLGRISHFFRSNCRTLGSLHAIGRHVSQCFSRNCFNRPQMCCDGISDIFCSCCFVFYILCSGTWMLEIPHWFTEPMYLCTHPCTSLHCVAASGHLYFISTHEVLYKRRIGRVCVSHLESPFESSL